MRLTKKQQEASGRLLTGGAENRIFWSDSGKIAKFIMGRLSAPSGDEPETIARAFIADNRELFDLAADVAERLEVSSIERDSQGHAHVCLAQFIREVPVHEGSMQVHINKDGVVIAYKDNRLAEADVDFQPQLQ